MNYILILGRQPELGLLELESRFGAEAVMPWGRDTALVSSELIDLGSLGGAQKLARVIYRGPAQDLNHAPIDLAELPLRESGKTNIGLSFYGVRATNRFVQSVGLTLKKRLKVRGGIRLVSPQTGTNLGAAQVKFNGLVGNRGFELVLAQNNTEMVVGITEQVQDIDWYAIRDYQRPARNPKVGMLPPKLAQIMINTTSSPVIFDPFCGTGVLLQEALLLHRSSCGSDLSPEMVAASKENMAWLAAKRPGLKPWSVNRADARNVKLPTDELAVVSEGYLGQNFSRLATPADISKFQPVLLKLYSDCLVNFAWQLKTNSEVTITAPVWRTPKGWAELGLIDQLSDLGYSLKRFTHVESRALVYRRPNQFVGRQILVLKKK